MRVGFVFAGVASLGLLTVMAACTTEEVVVQGAAADGGVEGGSSSSSGSSGADAAPPDITITPTQLKDTVAVVVGITSDDYVVYVTLGTPATLEAIPVAGGTSEVIESPFDVNTTAVAVAGGAVGYWTNLSATQIGTFNLWTKAGGKKAALNNASSTELFAATEDGTRVAFSVSATETQSDIALADSATAAAITTGILDVADRVNLAAATAVTPTCSPNLRFAKKNLVAAFCVGTADTDNNARLYWVPEGSDVEVRLDDVGTGTAAGPIKPFYLFDKNATKLFAVAQSTASTGRIITPAATAGASTSVALEDGVALAGFLTDDGSSIVYRTTTGGIRRASTGPTPAPKTLVAAAKSFLGVSPDQTKLFFRTLDAVNNLIDIATSDATTENQTPKALVSTASTRPVGLTGAGDFIVYLTDLSANGNTLKSQPTIGGAEQTLTSNIAAAAPALAGEGIVLLVDPVQRSNVVYTSLKYVNAKTGDVSNVFADNVPQGGVAFTKDKIVYSKVAATGAGIFVATMP